MNWWRSGVLYQLYPRSFADADGDGHGDLEGVIEHLDHLAWLGVDAIWLNPIHPSPNADWGYDVADYLDVHPDFGDLATLDRLVARAGDHGIRVDPRPGAEPHERPTPVVPGRAIEQDRRAPGLVRVGRRLARRIAAEQLGVRVRRIRVDVGRDHAAVLPPQLPAASSPT